MTHKFSLEFILNAYGYSEGEIRNSLAELGEALQVAPGEAPYDFKVSIITGDPTLIFDACKELGRIKSVKVDEGRPEP